MAEKSPRLRFADFKTKRALLEQDFLQEPCLKGARLRIAEENPGCETGHKDVQYASPSYSIAWRINGAGADIGRRDGPK